MSTLRLKLRSPVGRDAGHASGSEVLAQPHQRHAEARTCLEDGFLDRTHEA